MFDYATLKLIWWVLVGVLLLGFAIMDGHDMGVGTLLPFVGKTDDERRAVYGILSSIDNVRTFASSLPCRCGYDYLRMEIEETADRFKEQVRNKLEQSFLNR